MAELGEVYEVCSGRCIGAKAGESHDEIILTFEQGSVQIHDVHSRSCKSSWQIPMSECFVCPAIYHAPSERCWVVKGTRQKDTVNSMELISWKTTEELRSGEVVRLTFRPFALLAAQTVKSPVLVYENGGVAMGGASPQLPERARRSKKTSELLLADLVHSDDKEYVCVVSCVSGVSSLRLWLLEQDGVSPLSQTTLHVDDDVSVSACCVCGHMLITLLSDGSLCKWCLKDVFNSQPLPPVLKQSITSPPIKLHLAALSDDYFAQVGVVNSGVQLSLWDVPYFTRQTTSKLTFDPMGICCVDSYVVMYGSQDVNVAMVTIGHVGGTLAAALGRGQSSSEACLKEKQRGVVSILTDPAKTPTLDQFMSNFVIFPDMDYTVVVQRLLGETGFWAKDALLKLLENHLFPSSLVGEVLEVVLEKKDWGLSGVVVKQCRDCVPENILVKMLETVLKLPDQLEGELTREQLLVMLLSVPVNDTLLQQPLSHLPSPTVVMLLEWLCCQVGIQQLLGPAQLQIGSTHPHLPYDSVLDWISILVDVHFTQLSLQPQTKHVLLKLHKSIFKQVKCLDHLSIVGATQAMSKPTPTNDNWLYKIENLPINI